MTTMMSGSERFHVGTGGQFSPTNAQLTPLIERELKAQGATPANVEELVKALLNDHAVREVYVEQFRAEEEQRLEQDEQRYLAAKQAEENAKVAEQSAALAELKAKLLGAKGITPEAQKRMMVVGWARALGAGQMVELPFAREHDGHDVCGAPDSVGCCEHKDAISEWAILPNGNPPYGLCPPIIEVYNDLYEESGKKAKVFLHSPNKDGLNVRAAYRRERELPVRAMVLALAFKHENELAFVPEPKLGEDGKLLCSMGGRLPCCDGTLVATRFPQWKGVPYGWCKNFADAAWTVFKTNRAAVDAGEEGMKYHYRLRSAGTLEEAKKAGDSFLNKRKENQQQNAKLNVKLQEWAMAYAHGDSAIKLLEPAGLKDGYKSFSVHYCAASKVAGCCKGDFKVARGNHTDGVVMGFCDRSSSAMYEAHKQITRAAEDGSFVGMAPQYLRTSSIEDAEEYAARWRERNQPDRDGGGRSPLGNHTNPGSLQKQERRKREKSDNDREFRAQTRGSGNGSGKKNRGNR